MAAYGHYRFTTDVNVLTTREGLDRIHEKLIGLGYVPSYPGARKSVRDTVTNVKIDFIIAGEYPVTASRGETGRELQLAQGAYDPSAG